jgi:hypothetical protein
VPAQKIEQPLGLAAARTEMDVGEEERAEATKAGVRGQSNSLVRDSLESPIWLIRIAVR